MFRRGSLEGGFPVVFYPLEICYFSGVFMKRPLKIIITGGPGTGKTSVLNVLRERGFHCEDEIARQIIIEQLELGSDRLPWKNVLAYSEIVFKRIAEKADQANKFPLTIFDRGAVDVLAYLNHGKIDIPAHMKNAIKGLGYHRTVFFAPFWDEIYQTDGERKEDMESARIISEEIMSTYDQLGFEIHLMAKVSSELRANEIQQYISSIITNE